MKNDFVAPEKDQFSVEELAKDWGIKDTVVKNYIYSQKTLRLAIHRDIVLEFVNSNSSDLFVKHELSSNGKEGAVSEFPKFLYLDIDDVSKSIEIIHGRDRKVWTFSEFQDFEGNKFYISKHKKSEDFEPSKVDGINARLHLTMPPTKKNLVVTRKERDRFRSKYFVPAKFDEDILNETHDHYSPELAIAIFEWSNLKNDNAWKHGVSTGIKKHLRSKYDKEKLSDSAIDQIAFVMNWRKKGGNPGFGKN